MALNKKYNIRYSGSTFYGENPVKKEVNSIEKIFKLAKNKDKSGGFRNITRIYKSKRIKGQWIFSGNFKNLSSVFWINVYDKKLANKISRELRNKKKYF